jgi:hypothetical protein
MNIRRTTHKLSFVWSFLGTLIGGDTCYERDINFDVHVLLKYIDGLQIR